MSVKWREMSNHVFQTIEKLLTTSSTAVLYLDIGDFWQKESDPSFHASLASLVDSSERKSVTQFRFRRDAAAHLISLLLQHLVIASIAHVAFDQTFITRKPDGRGKPVPSSGDFAKLLDYNVSHHGGRVAIGIDVTSDVRPACIGIDLVDLNTAGLAIVDDFRDIFSLSERIAIKTHVDPVLQHRYLFSFWALKEAFTKAIGTGLTADLLAIQFSNVPLLSESCMYSDSAKCHFHADLLAWKFQLYFLENCFILAVATPTSKLLCHTSTSVERILLPDLLSSVSVDIPRPTTTSDAD
ncbi:uncharacterized protein V1516DRAFT_674945 [Lipomyces oligophaga]|uniref:uncharacterized protein n=1 Tax=Lipomyces oligophaga TaxID=45792 RepID=UPI0034CF0D04